MLCVCVWERERGLESEREKVRGGAWYRGEKEGWMITVCCLYSQSCGNSVDGARSTPIQTHAADTPRARLRERNRGGGGEKTADGGVTETRETLGLFKPASSRSSS